MTPPFRRGLEVLESIGDLPPHEVQRLLLAATGWTRDRLYTGAGVDPAEMRTFTALVERRRMGEPLQYIEGTCDFGPLTLRCDERALVPRPETEQLWQLALSQFADPPDVVVDVGTGSGNLALACKHAWPQATVYAVDVAAEALALAAENVALTGLDVVLLRGEGLDPVPVGYRGRVDLIVSNPPYLAQAELQHLPVEVRDHEPIQALVAGDTGTEVLRGIAAAAAEWLRPGGVVACEISEFQAAEVADIFDELDGVISSDLAGKSRFVVGRRRR